MDEREFLKQQQAAAERMRRMHERSRFNDEPHAMPPTPDFVRLGSERRENTAGKNRQSGISEQPSAHNQSKALPQSSSSRGGLDIPMLDRLKDPDTALILGLMLLLFSENADRRLMLALLYILM